MKRKSRMEHENSRRLIKPLEAYILLPDRLCSANMGNIKYTPCMTDLLIKTLESSRWLIDTKLIPVHWLTLKLEPQKMVSVVAAVLPMINGRSRLFEPDQGNNQRFFRYKEDNTSSTTQTTIETLPGVNKWNFDQLVNLQAIVVVHWPDPSSELLERSTFRVPNAYTIHRALRQKKGITLGVPTHIREKCYVDLANISAPDRHIIFQSNRFTLSTSELALSLMSALSRGLLKDCNLVYSHWLQLLVKPERAIPSASVPDQAVATIPTHETSTASQVNHCSGSESHLTRNGFRSTALLYSKMPGHQTEKPSISGFHASVMSRPKRLKGSRLGLVGLSSELPCRIAKLAHVAFGMNVSYYQRHPIPNVPYTHYENLKDLLQAADFVILADDSLNQRMSTYARAKSSKRFDMLRRRRKPEVWLTYDHFVCFKPHAFLVCVTAIQCIDFVALNLALRYGQLRGAGVTMPIVWFTQLSDLEALRQMPNTFILPPATSSVCAHSEIRLQVAQEVLEIIAHVLCRPNYSEVSSDSQSFTTHTANYSNALLSTWDRKLSSVQHSRSAWPSTCDLTNDSNMHVSSTPFASSTSLSSSFCSLNSSWFSNMVKNGGRVLEALTCFWK